MSDEPPAPPVAIDDEDLAKSDIDLGGVSTENVNLVDESTKKPQNMPLNDDLFFSTISDPVDLEDSVEPEVANLRKNFFQRHNFKD